MPGGGTGIVYAMPVGTPQGIRQRSIKFETDLTVSGRSVAIINLTDPDTLAPYTVPEGYRLIIGIAIISCELPVWQHTYIVCTPGMIGDYRYLGRGQVEFPAYCATVVDEGTTPCIYVWNTDEEALGFSLAVNSIEERIAL